MFPAHFKNVRHLVSNSGGFYYHLRYLINRGSGWQHYTDSLEQWLSKLPINTSQPLVLLGASGGYTLPKSFLHKFNQVVSIDVDPLSPWILRKRFPKIPFDFENQNFFPKENGKIKFDHHRFSKNFPEGLVFFTNLLGQLAIEGDFDFVAFHSQLANREWISLHDRWLFQNWNPLNIPTFKDSTKEEVLKIVEKTPTAQQTFLQNFFHSSSKVECFEFPTSDLQASPNRAKASQVFLWQIQQHRSLLVEGIYHEPKKGTNALQFPKEDLNY